MKSIKDMSPNLEKVSKIISKQNQEKKDGFDLEELAKELSRRNSENKD